MPDKEFDKLFQAKFMDAEVEPSADLWGSIANKLEPRKKRGFPLMWMAAASVVVVASVMMLTQNQEKILLRGNGAEVAGVGNAASQVPAVVAATTTPEVMQETATVSHTSKVAYRAKSSSVMREVPAKQTDEQKNIFASVQPSETNDHLAIKNDIKRAPVKPLTIVPEETAVVETRNAPMIANVDQTKKTEFSELETVDENTDSKKGIRNVGDLVNYVVDKVDKREKKIIKFDTDDDDNSSIIGLNIGFLKLNKKNNNR